MNPTVGQRVAAVLSLVFFPAVPNLSPNAAHGRLPVVIGSPTEEEERWGGWGGEPTNQRQSSVTFKKHGVAITQRVL